MNDRVNVLSESYRQPRQSLTFLPEYDMKLLITLLALFSINIATASPKLAAFDAVPLQDSLAAKALSLDIAGAEPFRQQTFALKNNGELLGVLVPAKGLLRADMNACFIGWSREGKTVTRTIPTIGFAQWKGEACEDVKSVGVISQPGDEEIKVALIYTGTTIVETALVPVVLAINPRTGSVVVDNALTERVNYAVVDSVPKIRQFYAAHPGTSETFDSKKYIARITNWCSEGNVGCDDVTLDSKSKRTGNHIVLQGKTINVNCPDACDFRGYVFNNENYTYSFITNDFKVWTMNISQGDQVLDSETGTLN